MKPLEDVLEELAPKPDPEFAAEMERRMELGFPPERRRRRATARALWDRLAAQRPRSVAAVAASALLAVAIAVPLLTDDGSAPVERPAAREPVPSGVPLEDSQALRAPEEQDALVVPPPPGGGDIAPQVRDRHVERSAAVTLAADADELERVARSIFAVATRHDGFVLRSSFSAGEAGSGFFDLRVPSERLQEALNALSRLATVRTRSESSADVTGAVVSLRDRLRTARAERDGLLRRLERADSDRAARAIRRRLEIVGRALARLRAQLREMRERTAFAAVSVELLDAAGGGSPSEARDALDDALGALGEIGVFLIRALVVAVPLALLAALWWFALARVRRRARERTLA